MERRFGTSFEDVEAYTERAGPLGEMGAKGVAHLGRVAFAAENPAPAVVAHELAHVVQQRGGGSDGDAAPAQRAASERVAGIPPRSDPAEREAEAAARIAEGSGARPIHIRETAQSAPHLLRAEEAENAAAPESEAGAAFDIAGLFAEVDAEVDAARPRGDELEAAPEERSEAPRGEEGGAKAEEKEGRSGSRGVDLAIGAPSLQFAAIDAPRPESPAAAGPAPEIQPPPTEVAPKLAEQFSHLHFAGTRQRSRLQSCAAGESHRVRAAGEAETQALQAEVQALRAHVAAGFGGFRQEVAAERARARDRLAADREAQKARIDEIFQGEVDRVRDASTEKQEKAVDGGEKLAQRALDHGRAESKRAVLVAKQKAKAARTLGESKAQAYLATDENGDYEWEEAEDIAEMARSLSRTTARSIAGDGADAGEACLEAASKLAADLRGEGHALAKELQIPEADLEELRAQADGAKKEVDALYDESADELEDVVEAILLSLRQGEGAALARIDAAAEPMRQALAAGVEAAVGSVEAGRDQACRELSNAVNHVLEAGGEVGPERQEEAATILAELTGELNEAAQDGALGLEKVGDAGREALKEARVATIEALHAEVHRGLAQNASAVGGLSEKVGEIATSAEKGAKTIAEGLEPELAKIGDRILGELDQAYETGRQDLETKCETQSQEITKTADEAVEKMGEKLDKLGPEIDKEADLLEYGSFWDKFKAGVKAFGGAILSGLSGFLKDTFLTLLIGVAVVLAVAVIVVGLVLLAKGAALGLVLGLVLNAILLAASAAAALKVLALVALAAGVVSLGFAIYDTWHILRDPTKTVEQKWEAVGNATWEAVSLVGVTKFTKLGANGARKLKSLAKLKPKPPSPQHAGIKEDAQSIIDFAKPYTEGKSKTYDQAKTIWGASSEAWDRATDDGATPERLHGRRLEREALERGEGPSSVHIGADGSDWLGHPVTHRVGTQGVDISPLEEADVLYQEGDQVCLDEVVSTSRDLRHQLASNSERFEKLRAWRSRGENRHVEVVILQERGWLDLLIAPEARQREKGGGAEGALAGAADVLDVLVRLDMPLRIGDERLWPQQIDRLRQALRAKLDELVVEGSLSMAEFFELPELQTLPAALSFLELS